MAAPEPTATHDSPHGPSTAQPPPSSFRSSSRGPISRTLNLLGSKIANTLSPASEHGQGGSQLASSAATRIFADDESTLSGEKGEPLCLVISFLYFVIFKPSPPSNGVHHPNSDFSTLVTYLYLSNLPARTHSGLLSSILDTYGCATRCHGQAPQARRDAVHMHS